MSKNTLPPGWDERKVQELISHYNQQTDNDVTAEIEAAFNLQRLHYSQDQQLHITSRET
jgi:hypothetical protein